MVYVVMSETVHFSRFVKIVACKDKKQALQYKTVVLNALKKGDKIRGSSGFIFEKPSLTVITSQTLTCWGLGTCKKQLKQNGEYSRAKELFLKHFRGDENDLKKDYFNYAVANYQRKIKEVF